MMRLFALLLPLVVFVVSFVLVVRGLIMGVVPLVSLIVLALVVLFVASGVWRRFSLEGHDGL